MRDDLFQVDVVWKREANFGNANAPPQFPPHQRRESGSELRSVSEGLTVDTLPSFPLLQISLIAVQRWQWANCSDRR